MKKNLVYIFALMFALVGILSATSVLAAVDVDFGNVNDFEIPSALTLLTEVSQTYLLNFSINVSTLLSTNETEITNINITLPPELTFVAGSDYINSSYNATDMILWNLTRFTYYNASTGQVLLWSNTTVNGLNLTAFLDSTDNVSSTSIAQANISIRFNVTADANGVHRPIKFGFLTNITENDGAGIWNETYIINITTVDRYNYTIFAPNTTSPYFAPSNKPTQFLLRINNSNIGNYPDIDGNASLHQGSPVLMVNITIQSQNLTVTNETIEGSNTNASTVGRGINFTRVNESKFSWIANKTAGGGTFEILNASQYANFTFNFTPRHPGNYTLYVAVTDNHTLTNLTSYTIRVMDTQAPNITSFTCSPSEVYTGELITCPCEVSDDYYPGGSGVIVDVTTINTGAIGSQTETCTVTDGNGNVATATSTYTVNSAGADDSSGSTGGAGGGYTGATTHNIGLLSVGTSKILRSEAQENFKFETSTGTEFEGTVDSVSDSGVTLTLVLSTGDNKEFTINDGVQKVDLDLDGIYDLSITLSGVSSGEASLDMQEISETVPSSEISDTLPDTTGGDTTSDTTTATDESNLSWLWITLGVIVVIAGVIFYLTQKKGPVGVFLITLFSKSGGRSLRKK